MIHNKNKKCLVCGTKVQNTHTKYCNTNCRKAAQLEKAKNVAPSRREFTNIKKKLKKLNWAPCLLSKELLDPQRDAYLKERNKNRSVPYATLFLKYKGKR